MRCNFEVGQNVVCVRATCIACGQSVGLVEKNVYVVRSVDVGVVAAGVNVNGADAPGCYEILYGGFLPEHFRPVKPTDIGVFREALEPKTPAKGRELEKA